MPGSSVSMVVSAEIWMALTSVIVQLAGKETSVRKVDGQYLFRQG